MNGNSKEKKEFLQNQKSYEMEYSVVAIKETLGKNKEFMQAL